MLLHALKFIPHSAGFRICLMSPVVIYSLGVEIPVTAFHSVLSIWFKEHLFRVLCESMPMASLSTGSYRFLGLMVGIQEWRAEFSFTSPILMIAKWSESLGSLCFCAGFESYLRGSWWSVQIREERSCMFLVSYNADKEEQWAWVPLAQLRLSAREADGWDCELLKKGMDVSVQGKHPQSNSLNFEEVRRRTQSFQLFLEKCHRSFLSFLMNSKVLACPYHPEGPQFHMEERKI